MFLTKKIITESVKKTFLNAEKVVFKNLFTFLFHTKECKQINHAKKSMTKSVKKTFLNAEKVVFQNLFII